MLQLRATRVRRARPAVIVGIVDIDKYDNRDLLRSIGMFKVMMMMMMMMMMMIGIVLLKNPSSIALVKRESPALRVQLSNDSESLEHTS
jgi:hypothetical protein